MCVWRHQALGAFSAAGQVLGGREPRDEGRRSFLRQRDRDASTTGDHLAAPSRGAGWAQGQPGAFLTVNGEFKVDEAAASRAAVDDAKIVGRKVSPRTAGAAVDGVGDLKAVGGMALGVAQSPGAGERALWRRVGGRVGICRGFGRGHVPVRWLAQNCGDTILNAAGVVEADSMGAH